MRLGVILFLGASVIAAPAAAHWQNTTWGMTPAQVAAATGAELTGETGRGTRMAAKGRYAALGYEFESRFYFDEADRLMMVKLLLDDRTACDELHRTVQGLYGFPDRQNSETAHWVPGEGLDRVTIAHPTASSPACVLTYEPSVRQGAAGL